jgi:hypothetical protein
MNSIYVLDFFKTLEEWSEKLEAWLDKNYGNPVLWVAILAIGILFFKMMFSTLNKD